MKIKCLLLLALPFAGQAQEFRLASPRLRADSVFFNRATMVHMEFDLEKAAIHYRINGEADPSSAKYKRPVAVKKTCTISALVTHPDFLTGATSQLQLVKIEDTPLSVEMNRPAHEYYPGKGAVSLYDHRKGGKDLKDGNWLGFSGGSVEADCKFAQKKDHKNLIVSTLSDTKTWIFPPASITVLGMNDTGEWQEIGHWAVSDSKMSEEPSDYSRMVAVPLQSLKTDRIKIQVASFGLIPSGHPGAGSPAWVFLDELAFQ